MRLRLMRVRADHVPALAGGGPIAGRAAVRPDGRGARLLVVLLVARLRRRMVRRRAGALLDAATAAPGERTPLRPVGVEDGIGRRRRSPGPARTSYDGAGQLLPRVRPPPRRTRAGGGRVPGRPPGGGAGPSRRRGPRPLGIPVRDRHLQP
ncbi:hypothetical protein [Streptomyces prunicolor]|uniref:hypothetical protein n=1 Tax=Streptomyces prunicolor TaxID=67348 RepID=UPI00131A2FB3|nr:hypothetical protein [Streptomyces prunicolor]